MTINQDAFIWNALYLDGSSLPEFEGNKQHLFREINQDNLEWFSINGVNGYFSVNVKTGQFDLNGLNVWSYNLPRIEKKDGTSDVKYKLVYFKRKRIDFYPEGRKTTIQFVIGLECNYSNKNYQQLIWVQEDGSVIINGFK
jgi:hypothetical protein